ncbi:MAG: GAF domain-containing protein [Armatimonadota bacterium]|nr:GAF domain-containing protein [Armatimonadota bacterium]
MSGIRARFSPKTVQDSEQSEAVLTVGSDWLVQLLYWSLLIGLIPVTTSIVLPSGLPNPSPLCEALTGIFPCIAGIGVACYSWIRFASSRQFRWLLAATAFASFAVFHAAHIVSSVVAANGSYLALAADWFDALARIAAAGLLLIAALTKRKVSAPWGLRTHAQALFCWLAAAVASVIGVLYLAHDLHVYIGGDNSVTSLLATLSPYCAGAVVCTLSILVYVRRTITWHDRTSKIVCLWLFPTAMSCGVHAVSPSTSPAAWWQAHMFDLAAAAVVVIGLNIDNALSEGASTERLACLRAMHDISWSLAAAANLSSMLSAFVEVLGNATGARLVALYLLDEEGHSLRLEAVHGDEANELELGSRYGLDPQQRPGFHSGHTARALNSRTPQVVQDVFSDVEFVPWRVVAQHDGWVVSIPLLLHRDTAVGVLNLYVEHERQIAPEKLNLLETMAGLVAPAIQNRRNFVDLAAAMQRIEAGSDETADVDAIPEAA